MLGAALALIEDVAHAPSARAYGRKVGTAGGRLQLLLQQGLSVGEGGLLCTDDDEVAAFARSRRSPRDDHRYVGSPHRGRTDTMTGRLGFNYRLDEPRSALFLSRLGHLEAEIERRRELTLRYARCSRRSRGSSSRLRTPERAGLLLLRDPIMIDEDGRQAQVSSRMRERGIRRPSFTPPSTASHLCAERFPGVCGSITELASAHRARCPLPAGP